jgi:hypothetical protein
MIISPGMCHSASKKRVCYLSHPRFETDNRKPVAQAAIYLVPSQPCSDKSIVTPSGPVNFTSTLPRFAISSVPG